MHNYPNALCISDYSKFNIQGNWVEQEYNNIIIAAEYCKNTTDNGSMCASKEEIDQYARKTIYFLIRQDNLVDKFMYKAESEGL